MFGLTDSDLKVLVDNGIAVVCKVTESYNRHKVNLYIDPETTYELVKSLDGNETLHEWIDKKRG
jgi:hypothetical protein